MKPQPTIQCPLCQKKHFSRQAVMDCMTLDQKEEKAKNRRLQRIGYAEDKDYIKKLKQLSN
jgi:hypothetical protein